MKYLVGLSKLILIIVRLKSASFSKDCSAKELRSQSLINVIQSTNISKVPTIADQNYSLRACAPTLAINSSAPSLLDN